MRRVITVIIAAAVLFAAMVTTSYGASGNFDYKTRKAGKGYIARFYKNGDCIGKIKANKRLKVKVVKSGKLTAKKLKSRKGKYIVVEVINGKCLDSKGSGKTSDGYYISYKRVKGHGRGKNYTTYCIYGNNNSIDDVVIRVDFRK